MPLPARRRADRVHDALAQHVGQRAAEALQQAERQQIDAHVVVLEVRAWSFQLAALALAALVGAGSRLAVVIDLVGLAPQLALPLARLVQEMAPGDAGVVRAREPGPFDRGADRLVEPGYEAVGDGKAGQHRQVALGNGEGHVAARRVAPLGNDAAALEDHAGGAAARHHGPDDLAPRPCLVPLDVADVAPVRVVETARPRAVAGEREIDGRLQLAGIEAGVRRGDGPPGGCIGDVGMARVGGGRHAALIGDHFIEPTLHEPHAVRETPPRAPPSS